jgi:hypothetical protein
VFVERLQLTAHAARSGLDPAGMRREVQLSERPRASCELVDTDEQTESPDNSVAAAKT